MSEGKISKAQQRAVNKYVKENYDRINVTFPKGTKADIQAAAAQRGCSVNEFIKTAVETAMSMPVQTEAVPETAERQQAKQIIDLLPERKLHRLIWFLKGVLFDDD